MADTKPPSATNPQAAAYLPDARERAALESQFSRGDKAPPAPRLKITQEGASNKLSVGHKDQAVGYLLLMESVGTANAAFIDGLLKQLANVTAQGQKPDEDGLNFMLSVIRGIEPKNQAEALLAAQMAAVHMATLTFARRLAHVDTVTQQDSAERAFNKLARTFAMQLEALKRFRSGGEQRVVVQHVHVGEGGQAAVVGAIAQGGGDGGKHEGKPHAPPAALEHDTSVGAVLPPLRSTNTERKPVPVACNAREGSVSPSRRHQHRAKDG